MITVRQEKPDDGAAIRHVNEEAFGRPEEANLVDALRESGALTVSLVAVSDGVVVGHIAFSPVSLEPGTVAVRAVGLGPMAMLPTHQRQGIGLQLVQAGLDACCEAGYEFVVVLGHPDYYPRCGFVPAKTHGLDCEFEVPEDAFMVKVLREDASAELSGRVGYHPAFNSV